MDNNKDYYATLGVLPSAEDIVIRAAYRALAQRYHPDRYEGSKDEADARMAEINEAYKVLADPKLRQAYDQIRGSNTQSGESYFGEASDEPPPTFDPLAHDWNVALNYYPDLREIDVWLSKISWRLAYSFRAYLIEEKQFEQRAKVAKALERRFLETYFGTNERILEFARYVIAHGQRAAARSLNEAIRVLGSNVDPDRVIRRIQETYSLDKATGMETFRALALKFHAWGYDENAICRELESRGLSETYAHWLAREAVRIGRG